jgi:hypothetical protein
MTSIKEALLVSKDNTITKINIYNDQNHNFLTVLPKSRNSFLLLEPNELFTIQLKNLDVVHFSEVLFEEIKIVAGKTYYIFKIYNQYHQNLKHDSFKSNAFYQNEICYGMANIISQKDNILIIETEEHINGRDVSVHGKIDHYFQSIPGTILWKKTINYRHYYALSFL